MVTITKTEAFKTSDGGLFESKERAIAHQKNIDFGAALNRFCEKHAAGTVEEETLRDIIIDNSRELHSMLSLIYGSN